MAKTDLQQVANVIAVVFFVFLCLMKAKKKDKPAIEICWGIQLQANRNKKFVQNEY